MHAAHHAVLRLFNLRFFLQPMSHSFNLFHAPQREVRKYFALDNTLAQQNTRAWIVQLAVNSCPCRQPIAKQQQNQCPIHEADFCKRQRMAGSMMIHKCSKSDKHCPSFFIILRVCFYFEKQWSGKSGKSISLTETCQPQGVDVSVGMPLRWDPFGRDGVRRQEVKGEWYADRADTLFLLFELTVGVWFVSSFRSFHSRQCWNLHAQDKREHELSCGNSYWGMVSSCCSVVVGYQLASCGFWRFLQSVNS